MATQLIGETVRIGDREYPASVDVSVNTDTIASDMPTIDPNWRKTDSNGHDHYYVRGYPTLDHIVDRQHWCEGNEGLGPHDPHWSVDESHYECLECRERIEPGLRPPGWSVEIVTSRDISVTVTEPVEYVEAEGSVRDLAGRFIPLRQDHASGEYPRTMFAFVPAA
jgi:hypothetical protein